MGGTERNKDPNLTAGGAAVVTEQEGALESDVVEFERDDGDFSEPRGPFQSLVEFAWGRLRVEVQNVLDVRRSMSADSAPPCAAGSQTTCSSPAPQESCGRWSASEGSRWDSVSRRFICPRDCCPYLKTVIESSADTRVSHLSHLSPQTSAASWLKYPNPWPPLTFRRTTSAPSSLTTRW